MPKTIAYIRVSTAEQDAENQRLQLFEYAHKRKICIDEFIAVEMSSRRTPVQRRVGELLEKLSQGDTLIVTEISRLGRSTAEVIQLIDSLLESGIRLVAIKQGLDLNAHDMSSKIVVTMFSLLAELERDLISQRTKDALAAKRNQGIKLGKPLGTIQKSKFDKDRDKVIELLALGLSVRKIAGFLGYESHIGLNTYVRKRQLREEAARKKTNLGGLTDNNEM